MSDKKTDVEIGFEEKLAKITNKKSRTRTNNDIYDRFISRVQGTEDGCNDNNNTQSRDKVTDSIAAETADTETVFDFSNQKAFVEGVFDTDKSLEVESDDNHLDDDNNNAIDSGSDVQSDPEATIYDDWDTQEAQIPEVVSEPEPAATAQKKLASSKKSLIMGIVFGSLLIAVIVAVLIFTGVLSTSTNTAVPDNAGSSLNNNIETIETEVTTNSMPADDIESETSTDESKPETEPSAIDTPVAPSQQDGVASESQSSTTNDAEATEVPLSEAASNESEADTTISYEAFRQESQNTLYRDTND
ncbi:hypothetical protein I6E61_03660 [Psychrobacter sp. NZS113]|uniref:hypothetical protein n=1 Tax=Psychrobacter sp. NZS113 TaxID=2792045 RepID=UPI0018CD0E9B|nr:hypothetical protein [Psychrobacter sp. NZS113]MBH0095479.1 hypothetical protein [Psychrobacter sp. NZS113]